MSGPGFCASDSLLEPQLTPSPSWAQIGQEDDSEDTSPTLLSTHTLEHVPGYTPAVKDDSF